MDMKDVNKALNIAVNVVQNLKEENKRLKEENEKLLLTIENLSSNGNQVSIIINGVRYDAVYGKSCTKCDLIEYCTSKLEPCNMFAEKMLLFKIFKKSDKSLKYNPIKIE